MAITPLPDPPTRADPSSFPDRADDFLSALPLFTAQVNDIAAQMFAAAVTAINAPGTVATSTTNLTIGTGSKTLTVQTGKQFAIGQYVMIARTAGPSSYLHGQVTDYNSGTGALTVSVSSTGGTGSYAAWTVSLSLPQIAMPLSGNAEVTGPVRFAALTRMGGNLLFDGNFPLIQFNTGGPAAWVPAANCLAIGTAETLYQRMLFDASGSIYVHGPRQSSGFMPGSGTLRVVAGYAGGVALNTFDTIDYRAIQFVRDKFGTPSEIGSIYVTDTSVSYNTTSDYRLKENVAPIENAVERVLSVPACRFNFIGRAERVVDGFLAHEVAAGVPEAVQGEKDAVVDIGTAAPPPAPAAIVDVHFSEVPPGWGWTVTGMDGAEPIGIATPPPAPDRIEGIPQSQCPEGWTWKKTGDRPAYQSIDQAKLVPVLWAAVQELAGRVAALEAQLGAAA